MSIDTDVEDAANASSVEEPPYLEERPDSDASDSEESEADDDGETVVKLRIGRANVLLFAVICRRWSRGRDSCGSVGDVVEWPGHVAVTVPVNEATFRRVSVSWHRDKLQ